MLHVVSGKFNAYKFSPSVKQLKVIMVFKAVEAPSVAFLISQTEADSCMIK